MLKKIEHQGNALLRLFKLEEVGRLGHEIIVERHYVVEVHARQE